MTTPAERRRYPRHPISLSGRIARAGTPGAAGPQGCQVRDYCEGGMLVDLRSPAEPGFAVGAGVSLTIELRTPAGERPITIPASVVWAREAFLGLAFAKPSRVIVDALQVHQRLSASASPVSPQADSRDQGRCLARMRHVAQGAVPAILRELLGQTVEQLLDSVDRVSSDTERQQVYADLTALEGLSKRDLVMREIMAQALNPVQDSAPDKPPAEAELSLVDTDEFERWLEASRAATQLERLFGEQLSGMSNRLASLRSPDAAHSLAVPFEPKHFTEALKIVAEQIDLGAVTRGVLFDRCVSVLGERLGELYRELEAVLDAAGLAERPAMRLPATDSRQTAADGSPPAQPRPDKQPPDQEPGPAQAATPNPAAVPAADGIVGAENLVAVDARALEVLLAREREQREEQARVLLDDLVEGHATDQGMSGWLQMIDGSIVKQAVADPDFFQASDTPMRAIVDTLGHLQLFRPSPELDVSEDMLRQRIDSLLAPLAQGQADAALIGNISQRLGELADEQSADYQRNVERVFEASEGRDRVRRARVRVDSVLDERYAGRRVPAILPELIDVGWRSVLELACLNDASRPDDFPAMLALLDSVVAHLGGEAFDAFSPSVDKPALLARIAGELETTAVDPFRRNAVESRLRNELLGVSVKDIEVIEMPALAQATDSPAQRPAEIPANAWERALAKCAEIRLGDRVHFSNLGNGEQVLRVAWIREDREVFTLVDHRGIRARDIGLGELAVGVHERSIRLEPVDGRPLSGRAVDRMLEDMEDRLTHLAAHDSLTGLINRRQFHSALEKALRSSPAGADDGALLWVDIDQFKLINDIHGYATGDRLLVAVAALLQRLGGDKTLGHLGADRFAILAPGLSLDAAARWAEAFRDAAREMPFDWQGSATALTVSIGVVGLNAAGGEPGDAIQDAEQALAAAKTAGGDQVHLYREDDPDILRQRESVKWVARVDEALVDGELRLRCQPIVPVRAGDGIAPHYEVLLGVADGSRQALPIAEFIEAAERYKRMRAVDRWVTRAVFDWVASHRDLMPQLHGFAVNLSGQTASDPAFVEFVRDQFKRTAIEPDWISFEVTETAAVASLTGTAGIIHELKRMGCKVALDDFGSGLASYSYLKELPVDWLKIDGVFVRDIVTDREDYAVVKSINDIGHFLGKKTIAEYVKDQPTLELIREIGVDLAQGFGIAQPMLMDDLVPQAQQLAASR